MDANRNELLGALASDAGLERADFLVDGDGPAEAVPGRERRAARPRSAG